MMPSIARMVIVPMDPAFNNGAEEAPAIITRVWNQGCVNVRILADGDGNPEWRTSVALHPDEESARANGSRHVAWWPPRVH